MKFNFIFFSIFILYSCTPLPPTLNLDKTYSAKGLAYIYNENDYNNKIIKGKMNNKIMQISHQNLKTGTLIKVSNPKSKKTVVLKNIKRIKYPDFYKILITTPVAEELDLNKELPLLEITEVKKNKSFIAKKAKIFNEEKKISTKAPVTSVQISNISKNNSLKQINKSNKIFIHIGTFYSSKTASFLKKRIIEEISNLDQQKIKLKRINNKETQVISGPYTTVNSLKNDYIKLKSFGFEELDIYLNE